MPSTLPWLDGLVGDPEIEAEIGPERVMVHMLAFERALARASAEEGVIPEAAAGPIEGACDAFRPDHPGLREATARDGVVVPELVRQLRAHVPEPHRAHLHHGATSQDIIDTAQALALRSANDVLAARIRDLLSGLDDLAARFGAHTLTGRTRMQAAAPIAGAQRIATWRAPLARHADRLERVRRQVEILHLGGAAGDRAVLGDAGAAVAARMAAALGLHDTGDVRHAARDGLADYAGWLSLVTGSLGKMGQDVALMAQDEVAEIALSSAGGSSAMPHKRNPVKAEALVALARFNAVQVSGAHHALVHEQERSGAAWTLEWMILPAMLVATGAATRTALELIGSITRIGRMTRRGTAKHDGHDAAHPGRHRRRRARPASSSRGC